MILDPGLDLFPLTAAVLAAVTCGLLGNFLVLRRLSLMGDAISHAVLPGLVVGFLVTTSMNSTVMFVGAGLAGLVTVVLIELVKKLGRVEPGAAMGVVFTVMFALGVLLMEQAAARNVHLDADCLLYGQLETLVWFEAPPTLAELWSWRTAEAAPRQVKVLLATCGLSALFVLLFFKELRLAAFDPGLATAQGIHAGVMHYLLMVFVAAATVASFEAVGSILVIAMLVGPAAAARLLTDRLGVQVLLSVAAALICGVGGYTAATLVPALLDAGSVNAAGSMSVVAGLLVAAAACFSPSHGVVARAMRRRRLRRESALDDVLATLLRLREAGRDESSIEALKRRPAFDARQAVARAQQRGLVEPSASGVRLTDQGLKRARAVLRRHRLWEDFLVSDAGFRADHVHETAEQLEHLTVAPGGPAITDPHGKPIPAPPTEEVEGRKSGP